jgi:hypothetical protein
MAPANSLAYYDTATAVKSYIAQAPGAGTIVSEIWKWKQDPSLVAMATEQHAFKNVSNHLNANIYSYLETSGGQSLTYI